MLGSWSEAGCGGQGWAVESACESESLRLFAL